MTDSFMQKIEATVRPHLPDLWRKVSVLTALALALQPLVATAAGPSPSRPAAYAAAARRLAGLTDTRAARSSSSATIRPPLGGAYETVAEPEPRALATPS